jgi:hypothetical protein
MNERDELLDETTLRRALRFEADEAVPAFDIAAITALAGARPTWRGALVGVAACAVTALVAWSVWSALIALAPELVGPAAMFALDAVVAIATVLEPLAEVAAQPVVPFSLLAALGVAIIHELYERREHAHANAS